MRGLLSAITSKIFDRSDLSCCAKSEGNTYKEEMKTINLCAYLASGCVLLSGCERNHNYLVVLQTQTNPSGGSQTKQILTSGTRFTAADLNFVRTNEMGLNTNMSVVVLNIIRLDD